MKIKPKYKKRDIVIFKKDNKRYIIISAYYSIFENRNNYALVEYSLYKKIKSIKNHYYDGKKKVFITDDEITYDKIYYRQLKLNKLLEND